MPYATQLRELLEQLANTVDPETRRELIRQFGLALENRLTQINSNSAAVIGKVELDLREEINRLRREIIEAIELNRELTSGKTHQLSNFVMSLENKIDELMQMVMLQNPYDADE